MFEAGAGTASLIYIAALGSLPQGYYEAAAIDGAGFFARLRHVTFPQLAPLMVINFVGAFVAPFQGMGSIFLLTFGGPGDATQVLSLQIWKEAYKFSSFKEDGGPFENIIFCDDGKGMIEPTRISIEQIGERL